MTQLALAQLQDDFSDNDFTAFPPWTGDDLLFTVAEHQLKLNAPAEDGEAYLSAKSAAIQNASWQFDVKLAFNPSGSNYTRVYLMTDNVDLSSGVNGYFVSIGESRDEISLYRQTGNSSSKIIDGRDGTVNLSTVEVKVRVTRDADGGWQLFTDIGLTGTYTSEGSAIDDSYLTSRYFGVRCTFTATRSDKFFFDNFNVQGNTVTDETPPEVLSLEAASVNELKLNFSESLAEASATTTENYVVDHAVGKPTTVGLDQDQRSVVLKFENHFPENVHAHLTISGITDLTGNEIEPTEREFIYAPPVIVNSKDVVIAEIFADPSPVLGLPESEFVEIFNRSDQAINLTGWKFTDQSAIATLPDYVLLPQKYLVLTAENSDFSSYNNVLHLKNFPSLNNASDVLILKNANDVTIDSLKYFDTWYRDEDKRTGGWTLEIIDPQNICSERENWTASEDPTGGTPGKQNAVFANKPDLTAPGLISVVPVSSSLIQLQFDEKLEKKLPASTSFTIIPHVEINNVLFAGPALTQLQLSLATEIQSGVAYSLAAKDIYDCAGNVISTEDALTFGLPEKADTLDILVNEVLFNPKPTGVDFVEIINASSKFINLKNWSIANFEEGVLENKKVLTPDDLLFSPGGILAITEDPGILKGEYLVSDERTFLRIDALPGLNDDQGSVALIDPDGNVIDYFGYHKDMHSIFIKNDEGVSLERISIRTATDQQNWKSASSSVGNATPGYQNSNTLPETGTASGVLTVAPEIFDPLSGHPDFTQIHYNFEKGGYVATVRVFDAQGRAIKEIANNDILGTSGFYRWDGDRDDGTKASIGYYMIWFEIFDEQGIVRTFQKRIAIATAF